MDILACCRQRRKKNKKTSATSLCEQAPTSSPLSPTMPTPMAPIRPMRRPKKVMSLTPALISTQTPAMTLTRSTPRRIKYKAPQPLKAMLPLERATASVSTAETVTQMASMLSKVTLPTAATESMPENLPSTVGEPTPDIESTLMKGQILATTLKAMSPRNGLHGDTLKNLSHLPAQTLTRTTRKRKKYKAPQPPKALTPLDLPMVSSQERATTSVLTPAAVSVVTAETVSPVESVPPLATVLKAATVTTVIAVRTPTNPLQPVIAPTSEFKPTPMKGQLPPEISTTSGPPKVSLVPTTLKTPSSPSLTPAHSLAPTLTRSTHKRKKYKAPQPPKALPSLESPMLSSKERATATVLTVATVPTSASVLTANVVATNGYVPTATTLQTATTVSTAATLPAQITVPPSIKEPSSIKGRVQPTTVPALRPTKVLSPSTTLKNPSLPELQPAQSLMRTTQKRKKYKAPQPPKHLTSLVSPTPAPTLSTQ